MCADDVVPVISPISAGPDGRYNVNADHAAGAIAGSVRASRIYFLTNVPGVMKGNKILPRLRKKEAFALIEQGVIQGGMIPKTHAALNALVYGVEEALITDLAGLNTGQGTLLVH
jgi:acetylglutamate kinase